MSWDKPGRSLHTLSNSAWIIKGVNFLGHNHDEATLFFAKIPFQLLQKAFNQLEFIWYAKSQTRILLKSPIQQSETNKQLITLA